MILPKYPIYIPSKGRWNQCLTAKFLLRENIPFKLVIEPQEFELYSSVYDKDLLLALPFSNLGKGSIPARNWIKAQATESGYERHWQLDDNIREIYRWYKGTRIRCDSGVALRVVEDFTDRFENVAISGMNYYTFGISNRPAFAVNVHVYSCTLILNSIPYQWRGRYNEDTDICLQVLAGGWCTILINTFLCQKMRTMTIKGGNTDQLYQGDGRLKMAHALARMWPGVVRISRRFKRPQHVINWTKFKTPLKYKHDINPENIEPNEYGLKLKQVAPEIESAYLRSLVDYFDGGEHDQT